MKNNQEANNINFSSNQRLMDQYEIQIRYVRNDFEITKAILDAELASA